MVPKSVSFAHLITKKERATELPSPSPFRSCSTKRKAGGAKIPPLQQTLYRRSLFGLQNLAQNLFKKPTSRIPVFFSHPKYFKHIVQL
jgi:hypothetical protein